MAPDKLFSFIILLSLFAWSSCDEYVKYAALIFRHGDRTPVEPYPTDPYRNQSFWPVKFGELTNTGKNQHYSLGQWFRERYSHLLSTSFDPGEIRIRSTDVDRTLMSAQSNLAGLYPPSGASVWNSNLMWQPIPVHTLPEKEDAVVAMKKPCTAYDLEMQQFLHSNTYKKKLSQVQPVLDYLTAHTGSFIKDFSGICNIYDNLYIETLYNYTLPKWTKLVYPEKLQQPAGYSFEIPTATPVLARLKVGPIMKELMSHLSEAMTGKKNHRKVMMYSGHDFTVANILNALGLYDGRSPPYTATVIMELLADKATSTHYIRISYRDAVDIVEPKILDIPNCGEKCPVDKFITLYSNLMNVDFENECEKKQFSSFLGISFLLGLGLFAMIYITHKIHFSRMAREKWYIMHKMGAKEGGETHNEVLL